LRPFPWVTAVSFIRHQATKIVDEPIDSLLCSSGLERGDQMACVAENRRHASTSSWLSGASATGAHYVGASSKPHDDHRAQWMKFDCRRDVPFHTSGFGPTMPMEAAGIEPA
jgi:hypothetical protein